MAAAIAMGGHVRVGMEDTIYRWPHRDDLVARNCDSVADMVNLARILGREIATADDVRDWLKVEHHALAPA